MKKTKIIATFGPAIASQAKIRKLVSAGVNVFRINCSHGIAADFLSAARMIRAATRTGRFPVGILFDMSGPKLRLDRFTGRLAVKKGDRVTLVRRSTDLGKRSIAVNHPKIIDSLKAKDRIFIDDGNLIFQVVSRRGATVSIEAQNQGLLLPGKGINLPDSRIVIPTITAKDKRDIRTAIEAEADFIALSFVRSSADIVQARKLIQRGNGFQKIIAKLEKREAIDDLESIIRLSDGIMIARGDLGVELQPEELPPLQKRIITLANVRQKPVIVATQMLESMRFSPRATRAEINDVASAVFDHTDAVMLSAETATGQYPLETVQTMSKVIEASESAAQPPVNMPHHDCSRTEAPMAIAEAVRSAQNLCDIRLILAFTTSGFTAELISNLFPGKPVIALTSNPRVLRHLTLFRSVYAVRAEIICSVKDFLTTVNRVCLKNKLAQPGDKVIITGGAPFGKARPTNLMMVHEI